MKRIYRYVMLLLVLSAAIIAGLALPDMIFRFSDREEAAQIYSEPITALDITLTPDSSLSTAEKMLLISDEKPQRILTSSTQSQPWEVCDGAFDFLAAVWKNIGGDAEMLLEQSRITYSESTLFFDGKMEKSALVWHIGVEVKDDDSDVVFIADFIIDDETLTVLGVNLFSDAYTYGIITMEWYRLASAVMDQLQKQCPSVSMWKQKEIYIGSNRYVENIFNVRDEYGDYRFILYMDIDTINFNYYNWAGERIEAEAVR